MNEQQIKEIFSDEDFVMSILDLETAEEVQKALSDKGLDLSLEEIDAIRVALENENGELSEEQLENVAGGVAPLAVVGAVVGVISVAAKLTDVIVSAFRRRW